MDRIRVAVLMGGPSSEHDVSLRSGARVVDALDRRRYEVRAVLITREGRWKTSAKAVEGGPSPRGGRATRFDPLSPDVSWKEASGPWEALEELASWRTDVALPILHGRFGEDGVVQACLAAAGIRFAGSGVRGSALAIDKVRTKEVLAYHRIATAPFRVLGRDEIARGRHAAAEDVVAALGTPVVVKDPLGGSSLEVRVCDDARETALALEALGAPSGGPVPDRLLVEAYVAGRELTGGVLDDRERGRPIALPLVELRPRRARFFDHREKYDTEGATETCPADVPDGVEAAGRAVALRVHEILGLRGVSRTDMILSGDGALVVLETNTMPGLTERSLVPLAAAAAGIDFPALVERLIRTAGLD